MATAGIRKVSGKKPSQAGVRNAKRSPLGGTKAKSRTRNLASTIAHRRAQPAIILSGASGKRRLKK